jgi:hypothetical protein
MSRHPAPLAGLGGVVGSGVSATASSNSVVTSVTSSASPRKENASVPTSVVRDELVRAVMPELHVLMQHLVEAAVERSIAPLLNNQRELEAALKELRSAQLRTEQALHTSAKHAPELATPAAAARVETRPVAGPAAPSMSRGEVAPSPAAVVEHRVAPARPGGSTTRAYDVNALADIPLALNGSRRKRVVLWAFAVTVVALLLAAFGLSALSNMGTYL